MTSYTTINEHMKKVIHDLHACKIRIGKNAPTRKILDFLQYPVAQYLNTITLINPGAIRYVIESHPKYGCFFSVGILITYMVGNGGYIDMHGINFRTESVESAQKKILLKLVNLFVSDEPTESPMLLNGCMVALDSKVFKRAVRQANNADIRNNTMAAKDARAYKKAMDALNRTVKFTKNIN